MREILIKFPIVWNENQYYMLTEIYLPMIESYHEVEDKKKYILLSLNYITNMFQL